MTEANDTRRIDGIQKLRGIAALAVALYHFSINDRISWPPNIVTAGEFGKFGVQTFFVISGFILPYSLWKAQYRLRDSGRFLLKRVLRLDPPYLASIVVSLAALIAAARNGGKAVQITWQQIALHLGFLTVFSNYEWLNTVYWTLAIEFQFYLMLALVFPLLKTRSRWLLLGALSGFGWLIPNILFFPGQSSFFLLGIGVFLAYAGICGVWESAMWLAASIALTFWAHGWIETAVGSVSALLMVAPWFQHRSRILGFLGTISYSLYLLHVPFGEKLLSVTAARSHGLALFGWFCCDLAMTLLVSWLFYRLIEYPSQKLAARVRYVDPQPLPEIRQPLAQSSQLE
jgi:peptidoglycan/LPS O-acetylase OafA/YrhL